MKKTVVAIFNSKNEADNAEEQLLSNGFDSDDIDVSEGRTSSRGHEHEGESGITRFFKNLFGSSDHQSERYSRVAENGYVVTVYADSDLNAQRAADLLDSYGAIDVDENYEKNFSHNYKGDVSDQDYSGNVGDENYRENVNDENYRRNVGDVSYGKNARDENDSDLRNKTIPIIEEDIKVGKKEILTGGVRIRSRIIERPVEENIRLREEHIRVDRNKVDRAATDDELENIETGTVELREHAEVPEVRKTSRVVEEVSLDKEVKHRDEVVRDTVRKTEVDVEKLEEDKYSNKENRDKSINRNDDAYRN
jgi:stress response protein YsnF